MHPFWKAGIFPMILVGLICQPAGAQESPTVGLLYSRSKDHAITYQCAVSDAKLNCDFVQMIVRKKIKLQALSKKLPAGGGELPPTSIGSKHEDKTCLISANAFKQSFIWTGNYKGGQGAWVVIAHPEEVCGVTQMSRFEVGKKINGFTFWKYVAQKAVTRPEGMIMDHKCGEVLDLGEHIYDWVNIQSSRMDCEFMEFSFF